MCNTLSWKRNSTIYKKNCCHIIGKQKISQTNSKFITIVERFDIIKSRTRLLKRICKSAFGPLRRGDNIAVPAQIPLGKTLYFFQTNKQEKYGCISFKLCDAIHTLKRIKIIQIYQSADWSRSHLADCKHDSQLKSDIKNANGNNQKTIMITAQRVKITMDSMGTFYINV